MSSGSSQSAFTKVYCLPINTHASMADKCGTEYNLLQFPLLIHKAIIKLTLVTNCLLFVSWQDIQKNHTHVITVKSLDK